MRAALQRGVEPALSAAQKAGIRDVARASPVAGLAFLAGGALFAGGGSDDGPLTWIGGGALVLALGASAAAFVGLVPLPRPTRLGGVSLALLTGFVLWNGVSVIWSIAPDRSWAYFNRGLVYLAFVLLGTFLGAQLWRAPTAVARGLIALVTGVLIVALAGKVFPALYSDGARIARLRDPVGFWNVLALVFALALPLALWLAGDRRRPAARAGAAVLVYGLLIGILLTYSRAGLLAGVLACAAWLVVAPRRLESAAALLAGGSFGASVAIWAFGQPGVADDGQDYATRAADGAQFGIVLVLGGAAAWALAFALFRYAVPHFPARRPSLRRVALPAGLLAAAFLAALLIVKADEAGSWVEAQATEFANPPSELLTQDPSRLGSLSSNNRWDWWQEAWVAFRTEPARGTGAGSFETTHRLLRDNSLSVTEPHSLPLQFLSETGLVGALLAGGAAVTGLLVVLGTVKQLAGPERAPAAALAIGVALYAVHSLADWNWDFVAVSGPVFAVFGVLLTAGRPASRAGRRPLAVLGALAVLLAGLFSLGSPWLAERKVDAAYERLAEGQARSALDAAGDARTLNPVAFEPLLALSVAQTALGDLQGARDSLETAVDLQPANPDTWFELGLFELEVARRPEAALTALERAYELDPYGPAGPVLERVRTP